MSACRFIASDLPLPEFSPSKEYPLEINIDNGTIYDGDADDNYFLLTFKESDYYSKKRYGVYLEWRYTDGRAKQLIEYIKTALQKTETIEFWHVWLMDYYEYEDRPFIHKKVISMDELTTEHIKELENAEIWNRPDKLYPERPSFYCLTIRR